MEEIKSYFHSSNGSYSNKDKSGIRKSIGIAWFDVIQLESGATVNKFNLLENSSMESINSAYIPTNWIGNNLTTSDIASTAAERLGTYGFKIVGTAGSKKQLVQDVIIKGNESDTYIVGGWAKASSVPKGDDTKKIKLSIRD